MNDFSAPHSSTYKVIHVENKEETSRGKHHKPIALATYTDRPFPQILWNANSSQNRSHSRSQC